MSNKSLIADVLAGNRVVNRDEKMERTINVMCKNLNKQETMRKNSKATNESDRGYGQGRRMGD